MRKLSTLMKVLISVLIFIVIPLIIVTFILSNQIMTYYESQMHSTNISNLKLVKDKNENLIKTIETDTITIASNSMINDLIKIDSYDKIMNSTDNVILINQLISSLSNNLYGYQQLDSIYVYKDGADYLLTTRSGIERLSNYNDIGWIKTYDELMKSGDIEICFPRSISSEAYNSGKENISGKSVNTSYKVITYIFKLTSLTSTLRGAVIVNISESSVNNLINKYSSESNGEISVINSTGTIMLNNDAEIVGNDISKKEYITKILNDKSDNGYISVKNYNDEIIYTYIKSDLFNWIYIKSQSLNKIMAQTSELSVKWVITTDFIIMLGLILTILVIRRIYKPLQLIIKEITQSQNFADGSSKDEYTIISEAFKKMSDQQKLMNEQLEARNSEIIEVYLLDLLKGNTKKYEREEKPKNIEFKHENYKVAILSLDNDFSDYTAEQKYYYRLTLIKAVQEHFADEYQCYAVMYNDLSVGVIVNFSQNIEDIEQPLIEIFKKIKTVLFETLNVSLSVGIGDICNSNYMIKNSAIQAIRALDRRILTGKGSINIWNPKMDVSEKYYYPYDSEKRIFNELNTRNIAAIQNELDELVVEIKTIKEISPDNIISIFNRLISATNNYLADTDTNVSNIFGNINSIYMQLSSKNIIDEIILFMKEFYTKICDYKQLEQDKGGYFEKIIDYFKHNFKREINFETMADDIGISYSYLRKIIKEETDKTLLEYLTDLRMEEAKCLLKGSNISICDISNQIGFSNLQSFNRFFKKNEGITASEYRKALS